MYMYVYAEVLAWHGMAWHGMAWHGMACEVTSHHRAS